MRLHTFHQCRYENSSFICVSVQAGGNPVSDLKQNTFQTSTYAMVMGL